MEAQSFTANTQLGRYLKHIEHNDKVNIISTTNQYVTAKRTCGDVQNTYLKLLNSIKQMGAKYGFNAFENNKNAVEVIDEFASKVEMGTKILLGGKTYTCSFNSIEEANVWLTYQKDIEIKNIQVETTHAGLKVTKVKIEYTIYEQPVNTTYQIAEVKKTRIFFASNHQKFNRKWMAKNPQYTLVTSIKRNWGFRLIGGSVGYFRFIKEKYVVLYTLKNS